MTYQKIFDPPTTYQASDTTPENSVDRRDGSVYVFHVPDIVLAVNVALATARPLFLRGPTGAGKSSLARSVARIMNRRYYEKVISSRTTLQDLLWRIDALKRLGDAEAGALKEKIEAYIEPGVLWWAFDPASAREMGGGSDQQNVQDPCIPAVVLLDEIDKADPDLPNDLLVPLGSLEFAVQPIDHQITGGRPAPLVVITTNEEREMPPAFLRRCIVLNLPPPTRETMLAIAVAHFGSERRPLCEAILEKAGAARTSAAELLDTIHACIQLGIDTSSEEWNRLALLTLWKNTGEAAW